MKYELYADVWFATNFAMDGIALGIAGRLMKQRVRSRRLILAALWGTAGSMALFFLLHNYTCYQLLVHFAVNPSMIWLCFRGKNAKEFLFQWFLTYLAVILLGGILEFSMGNSGSTLWYWICVGMAVSFLMVSEKVTGYFSRKKETVFDLILVTEEGQVKARGFYDTGNLLKDPMMNKPVHIVKKELLEKQLESGKLPMRLIPFHSLGKEAGLMEAVTLRGMYILMEETSVYLEKPVFGIAKEKLFQSDAYNVILNGTCLGN